MSDLSDEDLDLLADLLAGEGTDEQVARVAASPALSQVLADLSDAADLVVADLATLPDVAPPAGFDARLAAALAAEPGPPARSTSTPGGQTVVPLAEARSAHAERSRGGSSPWPLRVAAGVLGLGLLGGVGVLLSQTGGSSDNGNLAASAPQPKAAPTTASGRDYSDARGLAEALPQLLAITQARDAASAAEGAAGSSTNASGTATGGSGPAASSEVQAPAPLQAPARGAAPAPADLTALDRLRTPAGLTACLDALELPTGTQPLLLDYATWKGRPALVVLLPVAAQPTQVEAYVVGAGCQAGNEELLFFGRLDRP